MGRRIVFSEGEYYHLYNRGVEKRKIFCGPGDHERFVNLLWTANSTTPVHLSNHQGLSLIEIPRGETIIDIGAWCLMPNHFHLLVRGKEKTGISSFMKKLLTGYSMYFNTRYHRTGTLFDRPFRANHLDSDRYLKYQYAYIHLNPIGIVDNNWKNKIISDRAKAKNFLKSYDYSSLKDYVGHKRVEVSILNKQVFPKYFESASEFNDMADEWINFNDIKDSP